MSTLSLLNISFSYSRSNPLFSGLSAVFDSAHTVALVGDNGVGKTTLLQIISGVLAPTAGKIVQNASVYLLPQIAPKNTKSGGERQQNALIQAFSSMTDILLLDEPTNNLDTAARKTFFNMLRNWSGGAIIISHDRELLNRVDMIMEISQGALRCFGGNYDFYKMQKEIERQKLYADQANVENKIDQLKTTKRIAIEASQSSLSRLNTSREKGISTGHKFKHSGNHPADKIESVASKKLRLIQKKIDKKQEERQNISEQLRDDLIKIPIPSTPCKSRDLLIIDDISFGYDQDIFTHFSWCMHGNKRIRIAGSNGCGKTTLLKLICGQLTPRTGLIKLFGSAAYLDQDLSLLDREKSVLDNIMVHSKLLRHDSHALAANFGFRGSDASKQVGDLSGGELLKATLAAVLGGQNQPNLLILDEPTNNLDLKSISILEDALNQYRGGLLLISHDEHFIKNLEMDDTIWL